MVIFHPRQAPDQKPPVLLIKPDLVPPVGLFYCRTGRCLSLTNALHLGKILIEDKFMSDCFDKTEYLSGKTLYPNALGWSKSPMARQVAQWVSGHDFSLTGGSTPPRVAYCIEIATCSFRNQCQTKKDLLDLTSISPSDPFMGHLGICAYDLIE